MSANSNMHHSSYAMRKEHLPGLEKFFEQLQITSVGDLLNMLGKFSDDAIVALKPVAEVHAADKARAQTVQRSASVMRAQALEKLKTADPAALAAALKLLDASSNG
jgi:hypothetical protein